MLLRRYTKFSLLVLCCAISLSAVQIDEVLWGFDGKATVSGFTLLSVRVSNPTKQDFDGRINLHRTFLGTRRGAEIFEPCYLTAYESRWIQFYPYISEADEEWRLAWTRGRKHDTYKVTAPAFGTPTHVMLIDAESVVINATPVRAFRDQLFPPTVAATSGLRMVTLDHVPRWQPVRRQAFLDWVRGGGELQLLHDADGKRLNFSGPLAILNDPAAHFAVGNGLVTRRPITRHELQPPPSDSNAEGSEGILSRTAEESMFEELFRFTDSDFEWWLIFSVLAIYVILIFPVNYLFGRKLSDYRITLGFTMGTVVLFTAIVYFVGRRGYGEESSAHSVAYARPLGNGRFDVTQWTNLFTNAGGTYEIRYPGEFNLLSTCERDEKVDGMIMSGAKGGMHVKMPISSKRSYLHRAVMTGPDYGYAVKSTTSPVELVLNEKLQNDAVKVWRYVDTAWNQMRLDDGVYRDTELAALPDEELREQYGEFGFVDEFGRTLIDLARHATANTLKNRLGAGTAKNRLDFCVAVTTPAQFRLNSTHFTNQLRCVVYHYTEWLVEENSGEDN